MPEPTQHPMRIHSGTARSGDLDIYYEDMGDPGDPAVLLIMGLGAQMILWRTAFCEKLVARGFRVIRYDNRDVGLSSKLGRQKAQGAMIPRFVRFWLGAPSPAVYTLEDMSADAAALLDHLGIDRAHIVGASMGGMIAQIFAARHPGRTHSLGLIFTSNNHRFAAPPSPQALWALIGGPPAGSPREVVIDHSVRANRIIGSPGYPVPEDQLRAEAAESYDRCYYPWGYLRHLGAIFGSGSLERYDREISAPTAILHGADDKLVRPGGSAAIGRIVPNATRRLLPGMGHNLPEPLWDSIIAELTANFARAG